MTHIDQWGLVLGLIQKYLEQNREMLICVEMNRQSKN